MTDMTAAVVLTLKDKLSAGTKKIVGQVLLLRNALAKLGGSRIGGFFNRVLPGLGQKLSTLKGPVRNIGTAFGGLARGIGQTTLRIGLLGMAIGGFVALKAVSALKGLFNMAAGARIVGDELLNASASIGLSVQSLQELRYAAKMANIEQGTFDTSMKRFGVNAAAGANGNKKLGKQFQDLNVPLKDAQGNMRDLDSIFMDTVAAVSKLSDPLTRNRVAMQLFGRGGVDMVKMMTDGADGVKKLRDDIRPFAMTEADTKAAGAFDDVMVTLGEKIDSFRNKLGVQLMPALTKIATAISDWLSANNEMVRSGIVDWVGRFAEVLKQLADPSSQLSLTLKSFAESVSTMASNIGPLAQSLGGPFKVALLAIGGLLTAPLISSVAQLAVAFVRLGGALAGISGITVSAGLLATAGGIAAIAGSLYLLQQNRGGIMDWMEQFRVAADDFRARKPLVVDESKVPYGMAPFQKMDLIVSEYVSHFYTQINAAFQTFTASVRARAMGMGVAIKDGIISGLGSLFDVGAQWIGSLWEGIKAKAAELMAGLSSIAAQAKAALSIGGPVSTRNYSGSQMGPTPAAPSVGHDGARALGGSVYPGKSYLVGERGPEMIMPKRYGHVVPMGKGGGGRNVTVHMGGITINGNADQNTLSKLAQMLTEKLRAGLHDGAYA